MYECFRNKNICRSLRACPFFYCRQKHTFKTHFWPHIRLLPHFPIFSIWSPKTPYRIPKRLPSMGSSGRLWCSIGAPRLKYSLWVLRAVPGAILVSTRQPQISWTRRLFQFLLFAFVFFVWILFSFCYLFALIDYASFLQLIQTTVCESITFSSN